MKIRQRKKEIYRLQQYACPRLNVLWSRDAAIAKAAAYVQARRPVHLNALRTIRVVEPEVGILAGGQDL